MICKGTICCCCCCFATPWNVAHQAPLFMGFPRQEYWSGLPSPSPADLCDPVIKPSSPALAESSLTTSSVQLLSHVQLFGDPMGCSPPGFSVHGISQARILKGVAISFSSGSFGPTDWTCISCIGRKIPYWGATRCYHVGYYMVLNDAVILLNFTEKIKTQILSN